MHKWKQIPTTQKHQSNLKQNEFSLKRAQGLFVYTGGKLVAMCVCVLRTRAMDKRAPRMFLTKLTTAAMHIPALDDGTINWTRKNKIL